MAKLINKNVKFFMDDFEGIMSLFALGEGEYDGKNLLYLYVDMPGDGR